MANRAIDALIAFRLIKLLVTPFNKTEAYKLGIIDDKGKVLIKARDFPKSIKEKVFDLSWSKIGLVPEIYLKIIISADSSKYNKSGDKSKCEIFF